MRFYDDEAELAGAIARVWAIETDDDRQMVAGAIRVSLARMRRIHDVVRLLLPASKVGEWARSPIYHHETPMTLIRRGEPGVDMLDRILVQRFREAAPRHVFPVSGEPLDVETEACVLVRLLGDRLIAGGATQPLHHPVLMTWTPIESADRVIGEALISLLRRSDGPWARRAVVMGLSDHVAVVRRAAARAAAHVSGFPEIRGALAGLVVDDDESVRAGAVHTLVPFAADAEVANALLPFAFDVSARIRGGVLEGLCRVRRLPSEVRARLRAVAFDVDPDVRELARRLFSSEILSEYVASLRVRASRGGALVAGEIGVLARAECLDEAERAELVIARLEALMAHRTDADEFNETCRLLLELDAETADGVWARMDAGGITARLDVESWLNRAVRGHHGAACWPALVRSLSRRICDERAVMRAALAAAAVDLAIEDADRIDELCALTLDPDIDEQARRTLVWALGRGRLWTFEVESTLCLIARDPVQPEVLVHTAVVALIHRREETFTSIDGILDEASRRSPSIAALILRECRRCDRGEDDPPRR